MESDSENSVEANFKIPKPNLSHFDGSQSCSFTSPNHYRPKRGIPTPTFLDEPLSYSTKKERGSRPLKPPPKPQAKTCPPISRFFKRRPELAAAQSVKFLDTAEASSLTGTPLVSSPIYDADKTESYFEQAFTVISQIGAGCFGNVYKVRSKQDGKLYAVKIARERYRGNYDRMQKLEEVRKHQFLLPHKNCVRFHSSWEENARLYQQFELCQKSLLELAEEKHDLPESTIWAYLVDLLLAVKHLHDHDLIHMDIKPENIFIGMDGICKLGDFGLCIDLAKNEEERMVEGDPKYLAAEVLELRRFSKAADIFSLGVTILELACDLDLPNQGVLWNDLRKRGPDPKVTAKLSPDLRRVIELMMNNDPDRRYTVEQLLNLPAVQRAYTLRTRTLLFYSIANAVYSVVLWILELLLKPFHWFSDTLKPKMTSVNSKDQTPRHSSLDDSSRLLDGWLSTVALSNKKEKRLVAPSLQYFSSSDEEDNDLSFHLKLPVRLSYSEDVRDLNNGHDHLIQSTPGSHLKYVKSKYLHSPSCRITPKKINFDLTEADSSPSKNVSKPNDSSFSSKFSDNLPDSEPFSVTSLSNLAARFDCYSDSDDEHR